MHRAHAAQAGEKGAPGRGGPLAGVGLGKGPEGLMALTGYYIGVSPSLFET